MAFESMKPEYTMKKALPPAAIRAFCYLYQEDSPVDLLGEWISLHRHLG